MTQMSSCQHPVGTPQWAPQSTYYNLGPLQVTGSTPAARCRAAAAVPLVVDPSCGSAAGGTWREVVGAAGPIYGKAPVGSHEAGALEKSPDLEAGNGSPISEWYFSLKTSKGYCGLVTATAAAGGNGYAIACNNKYPQYGSSFAVLLPDGGVSSDGGGAAAAATAAAAAGNALQKHGGGGGTDGSLLTDASAPVVVTSGQAVRLLSRSAGLCNSPPALLQSPRPDRAVAAPPPPATPRLTGTVYEPYAWDSIVLQAARTAHLWLDVVRCGVARTMRCHKGYSPGGREQGSGAADVSSGPCGGSWCRWWCEGCLRGRTAGASGNGKKEDEDNGYGAASAVVGDAPPRAVICSLGQPPTVSYKIFKSDLKDGASVDLDKEWIYLREGDKYCTLADVAGLSAAISCHLDYPGWSGYKFQLQTMSYPRSQLHSLLTGSPCGVRLPGLSGPHDVVCQGGEQEGREAEVELVLQTPGSVLAAGVVVGISTFSPGLMGAELQRCCALTASPHILLCEPPPPASVPVANECWFQMYDVKIESPTPSPRNGGAAREEINGAAAAAAAAAGDGETPSGPGVGTATALKEPHHAAARVRGSSRFGSFLLSFLRSLQQEMSPAGLDPDLISEYAASDFLPLDSESNAVAGSQEDATADAAAGGSSSSSPLARWWSEEQRRRLLPLPRIRLEVVRRVEAAGDDTEQGHEDGGKGGEGEASRRTILGVSGGAARRLHHRDSDLDLDGQGGPQAQVVVQCNDGGDVSGDGGGGRQPSADSAAAAAAATAMQSTAAVQGAAAAAAGALWRSEGAVAVAAAAEWVAAVPPAQGQQRRGAGRWDWPWSWVVGAAAPLGDGSLVMLLSRAFGRYCSVSLDGTLLCVSAQASNASRNLFTLIMPPAASQAGRATVVAMEP
ncbi:hypothetical protein VOLCADRAFT_116730 [Volvox carteri f. nagariensis]|uniref:Uncharacterized protein n=1 Tax=Volvox carteri f. nagariensis TaxID=3068 RepID=D8TP68_VOLCA|nr:uncharacterized protein VOLCADRAFT_116730 [Volvox carteri f. nagariensis]EFJ50568.1 hypothetical protein VOLCADRAFT_116730 [Volvox carteri f. nagariensis]|eukprot:XP_002948161.1 hypothetical protein VOLCADRAFT_116730 [Volvox carteri f. nagariensis]